MKHPVARAAALGTGALGIVLVVPLVAAGPASAHASAQHRSDHQASRAPRVLYVSPKAVSAGSRTTSAQHAKNTGRSCSSARFSDIQAAIDAAPVGGKVVVCRGTYATSVTLDKRLTLQGEPGAVIDATAQPYGVGVGASWSTVRGLTVINSSGTDESLPYDGIVTAAFTATGPVPADHVTIEHNVVRGNHGSGIDLNSTSYSLARDNVAIENGVGVNVADDLGAPATHNLITDNITDRNFGGCGIALADHSGLGVTDNVVSWNVSDDNGLSTPTAPDASAGSGVILASPIPGGVVRNNVISFNEFRGNGHAGVVVHQHVPNIPDGPTADFSGNRLLNNVIGTNNLRTDTSDTHTTGIYLGSANPLAITVRGNRISRDYYGIFTAGDVTVTGNHNQFRHVTVRVAGVPTY